MFVVFHFAITLSFADHTGSVLTKFYKRVYVPPEAPEKTDHGDIDVLVDETLFNVTAEDLVKALDAKAHTKAGGNSSFAIQTPEDSEKFFQLDIHPCKNGYFEWESVLYSYGDIWIIIGSIATRFGLAINNHGFHIRVEELEVTRRKESLLLLTNKPQEIMEFLGLDGGRYAEGFITLDEIFEWATAMPFFRQEFFVREPVTNKKVRSKEQRPMYLKFVTEWLPRKADVGGVTALTKIPKQIFHQAQVLRTADSSILGITHGTDNEPTEEDSVEVSSTQERKDVLRRALLRFHKEAEYNKMLADHQERTMRDAMWKQIATTIPLDGKELGQAIVALKSLLRWNDGQPRLASEVDRPREKIPALDADTVERTVLPWIKDHWSETVRMYEGRTLTK